MEPAAPVEWSDPALHALRARLAQEFGAGARLDVGAGGATITLPALA